VNRRWADAKIFLHVCFGRRPAVQARVQVNKRQILALLGREGFCRATHCGHPIQLFVSASNEEEASMNVRYRVELSQTERTDLTALLSGGKHAARKLKRAQILLAADAGANDDDIATSVGVGGSTVYRTKQRFVLGNLQAALSEMPRSGASRKLSGKEEALLVATACSKPPQGRARWTLELLAGRLVSLTQHDSVSRETVRRRLAENDLKPWRKDMWCIPQVDGEYVARMEDVLDLYAEDPEPKCPVVCFDESPTQLIGELRQPIPAAPGQLERYDCEYKRVGRVEGIFQEGPRLVGNETKSSLEALLLDLPGQPLELVSATDEEKQDMRLVTQHLGGGKHAIKLVGAAEVSGITNHEFFLQAPCYA
jgi:transposase